jgi:hypothetical protein
LLTKIIFFFFLGTGVVPFPLFFSDPAFSPETGFGFCASVLTGFSFPSPDSFSAFDPLSAFGSFSAGFSAPDFFPVFGSFPAAGSFSAGSFSCFGFFAAGSPEVWTSFALFPNAFRTSCAASSSMELCAALASIPFSCKKLNISLLCLSSSLASSCTFIFAMPSSISAASGFTSLPIV